MTPDSLLIDYVHRIINRGDTEVAITTNMMKQASPMAIDQVRKLCKLNGVEIVVVAG